MPEILSIGELLDLGNSANMSAYIPYSGLEYNASGAISGISGSAIAGGVESSVVSSIVSSMVSGKVDQSAFEQCCDEVHSALDEKMDKSASGYFQPSGEYIYASASSQFAPSGDYAYASSLSSKLDASASGYFQPSGEYYSASNPSGFITGVDLSEYQEKSAMTGYQQSGDYAYNSAVSGKADQSAVEECCSAMSAAVSAKLDASASSQFAPSADYAYNSSLSSYVNYSAISGENSRITSIKGSAIGNSINTLPLYVDSANMSAVIDEMSSKVTIGVLTSALVTKDELSADLSAYEKTSSVNTKLLSKLNTSDFNTYTASVTPVVIVGSSAEATAANVVYVVTGLPE